MVLKIFFPSHLLLFSLFLCHSLSFSLNFNILSENKNYSCHEIIKWLKNEKHYSNNRRNSFFDLISEQNENENKKCLTSPILSIKDVIYSPNNKENKYFSSSSHSASSPSSSSSKNHKLKCEINDQIAVLFLSNFSINNNYSHFLHALLRLFCSLIDLKVFIWNNHTLQFEKQFNYSIWMDENFKLSNTLLEWMKPFQGTIKQLQSLSKGGCASTKSLTYGSGCVKLLPPEKWFGYPGCRANQILPAFSTFMKSFHGLTHQQLPSIYIINSKNSNNKYQIFSSPLEINQTMSSSSLNIVFGVRRVGSLTGKRTISNLQIVS